MCTSAGVHSARHTAPSIRKFNFSPIGFDGAQTKHRLAGDSIGEFILERPAKSLAIMMAFQKKTNRDHVSRHRATPRDLRGAALADSSIDATGRGRDDPS